MFLGMDSMVIPSFYIYIYTIISLGLVSFYSLNRNINILKLFTESFFVGPKMVILWHSYETLTLEPFILKVCFYAQPLYKEIAQLYEVNASY